MSVAASVRVAPSRPPLSPPAGLLAVQFEDALAGHRLDEQIGEGPDQGIDAIGRIAGRRPVKIGRKAAHLILELRKRSDLVHTPLLVECGDRLRPHHLAARRADGGERDIRIDHAKGRLDHLAAVVDLGDDAIGLMLAIEPDGDARPFGRRVAARTIAEDVAVPRGILAGDDNAGFVGILAARDAGSIATTMRVRSGSLL